MSESIWDDPRITSYVLDEMSESERAAFEAEIESSGELAAAVEEARMVTEQLASLYQEESVPGLDRDRRASILVDREPTKPAGYATRWLRLSVALATAAVVLVMIGVAPMMMERKGAEELALQREGGREQPSVAATQSASEFSLESEAADAEVHTTEEAVDTAMEEAAVVASGEAGGLATRELAQRALVESPAGRPEPMRRGVPEPGKSVLATDLSIMADDAPAIAPAPTSAPDTTPAPAASVAVASAPAQQTAPPQQSAEAQRARRFSASDANRLPSAPAADSSAERSASLDGLSISNQPLPAGMQASGGQAAAVPQLGFAEQDVDTMRRETVAEARTAAPARPLLAGQTAQPANAAAGQPLTPKIMVESEVRMADRQAGASLPLQKNSVEKIRMLGVQPGSRIPESITGGAIGGGAPTDEYALPIDEGRGPGIAGDRFEPITDNPFQRVSEHPLSTFSVDVDTASYSKVRDYLMRANQLPRPDAVRIEELVNYFSYDYQPPGDADEHPFAARVSVTACPWNEQHRLARIALKGKTMEAEERPRCNLVFLLDTSGSMNAPNKLPLVVEGMKMLLGQLNEDDQVAIAVYAGSAGLVLDSTPAKKEKKIRKALTELSAGGSTNGGAGIALAYQTARDNFIPDGVNRVILCTDGDFNVGTTGTDELVRMVEQEAKGGVFLSVLGFGMGNHNDAMLEQVSGRGNGNYAFIDNRLEAKKVLVEQTSGTLVTIAKDVKLQVEFNPAQVGAYRLIGYENRILAKEDFNDDKKDAGEIGAGHAVTALYEIVPAGVDADAMGPKVDDLKYQRPAEPSAAADSEELLTLKLRYKQPDGDTSTLVEFPVVDDGLAFAEADDDVRFAAAVASFGMQLRRSPYAGSWTLSDAMNAANRAKGEDRSGLRAEFVTLVQKASQLMGEE